MGAARVLGAVVASTVALTAVPATAEAWSIHNCRVRDAGPEIVGKVTVCTQVRRGYEQPFRLILFSEAVEGSDDSNYSRRVWLSRGCCRVVVAHDDDLEFRGTYYARMRVRGAGYIRESRWRRFWSS
jgi:hypothetical protein